MADRTGQELGNYRLISLLGRGGFAEVYLAEHLRLKTQAAIKVLYTQLEGEDTENFLSEARIVAHLIHPHIVRIFDYDVKDGVPFLVMDYAPNGNLRQHHPKNSRVPLETIASYIKQVADALQYAHDEKLIHRDIKPENMLLGRRNELLLSDFGIALIAQSTHMQSTQDVVGTAYYMAPEQLQGKPRLASDQYALGVVVYEWLTGTRPFHGSFSEIASQHMFVPPPLLCEKDPMISPAIEEVVMTALAKDPHKRFGNVRAFATALEQASESTRIFNRVTATSEPPVQSNTLNPPNQLSMIIAPPGQPLEQPGLQPTILQSGPVTSPSQGQMAPQPITSPQPGQSFPPVITDPAGQFPVWSSSSPSSLSSVTPPNRLISQSSLSYEPIPFLPKLTTPRRISRRAVLVGLAGLTGLALVGGGISWLVLSQKPPVGTALYTYHNHSDVVNEVAWSHYGQRIASASNDKTVQIWDDVSGNNLITYRGHSDWVTTAAWSPDGKRIASGGADQTVQVWDAATGRNVYTYSGHSAAVNAIAWAPDGKYIASGGDDKMVQVWDAVTGNNVYTYSGHSAAVYAIAWSPDGQHIASASADQTAQVWDASTGNNVYTYSGHSDAVFAVAWSPNGKYIASASSDQTVQVWDAAPRSSINMYNNGSGWVNLIKSGIGYYGLIPTSTICGAHCTPTPTPTHTPTPTSTPLLRITATPTPTPKPTYTPGSGTPTLTPTQTPPLSPTPTQNRTQSTNVYTYHGHSDWVKAVAWSPDGQRIVSGSADKTVQIWDASNGGNIYTYHGHSAAVSTVAWSSDGQRIALWFVG